MIQSLQSLKSPLFLFTMSPPHLNVVSLPGLLSEKERGDAGHEAAQEAVQQATLPHIISCGIGKAGSAAQPTTTYPHVSTTAAQALLPFCCHCHGVDLK